MSFRAIRAGTLLALCAGLLFSIGAHAQSIIQAGPAVGGHAPMYVIGPGQGFASVQDSGFASGLASNGSGTGTGVGEFLQVSRAPGTGPFGSHLCLYDAPVTSAAGFHYLCLDANASGGGLLAYGSGGAASPEPFNCIINGVSTPCIGSVPQISGIAFTPTNASLKALPMPPTSTQVLRGGFYANGDGGAAFYNFSGTACSLNAGSGDNGSQVKPTAGSGCWIADFSGSPSPSVQVWGAKCDGTTDDTVAITADIANAIAKGTAVGVPASANGCRSNTGLTFAQAAAVGLVPAHSGSVLGPPPIGPKLVCPATLGGACATFGQPLVNGVSGTPSFVRDLIISFSGTPPLTGDTAFLIQGFNTSLEDVVAHDAYDGFTWANGLASHAANVFVFAVSHSALVAKIPEVYLTSVRVGTDGGDYASANAYVELTGFVDTFQCVNCQFNFGGLSPHYLFDMHNITNANGVIQLDNITADMGAGNGIAIFHSDGSAGVPLRLQMNNAWIDLLPHGTLFDLNGAALNQVHISNSDLYFADPVVFPAMQYNFLGVENTFFGNVGAVTIDGTANAIAAFTNVGAQTSITVQGGPWGSLALSNIQVQTGYADNTATGNVYASGVPATSWTPQLEFGGGQTGMAAVSTGTASRQPDGSIKATFGITLSAAGSSLGSAQVLGLPYTCKTQTYDSDVVPVMAQNMTGLTSVPLATAVEGTTGVQLSEFGATGIGPMLSYAFTNTSIISATVRCVPQ